MDNNAEKPIVEMDDFSFRYTDSKSDNLSDMDITIKKGEFVLLTGKSGCGKTTFTRCVNGLIPDFFEGKLCGTCSICNMNIEKYETVNYSPYVGSVFQDPRSQFFTLHAKTEIAFGGENLGMERKDIQRRLNKAVNILKIGNLLNKSIFNLSSGEKQKVAIASSWMAGVNVFVLDEPSANLDTQGTRQLFEVLKELKRQGNTVIISEHKIYYLKGLVDRTILMQNGRIKEIITKKEFTEKSSTWFSDNGLRQINLSEIKPVLPNIMTVSKDVSINVENLSFYYDKDVPLWENISFKAKGGDIIGVIGENGAGKSTLFRVLMGLEKPKLGKIYMNGKYASKKVRKKNSFYVMQDVDYQLFGSSVLEEMLLGTSKNNEEKEKAINILRYFGLESYINVHPSRLSGGQKQRLSIALAYMSNSRFLFLDEPTSGLDGENMLLVRDAICKLAQKGCCIFVITHDYEFAANTFRSLIIFKSSKEIKRISQEKYDPSKLYKNFGFNKKENRIL